MLFGSFTAIEIFLVQSGGMCRQLEHTKARQVLILATTITWYVVSVHRTRVHKIRHLCRNNHICNEQSNIQSVFLFVIEILQYQLDHLEYTLFD